MSGGFFAVVFGLLSGALATSGAAADEVRRDRPPVPADESYFGINGTKLFHLPEPNNPQIRQRIAWMRELGVQWDRNDLWWHIVQPQRETWDFSRPDLIFATLDEAGVHWYPILCYGAVWFTGGRTALQSDEDFRLFAAYVEKTVERYRGRARYWEVWNEPNLYEFWHPDPSATQYARLLKATYPAIKRADPNALVCAPGVAPLGPWDRKFVEEMYQQGAADYFDVFDYHYYRNQPPEDEVPAEIAEIIAVMRHYDRRKFLQISESGVSAIWEGKPHQEERQAAMVVRNQLLSLANGVDRFYYFDLQNWRDDTPHDWASQLGLVTAAGKPKKAFYAVKTLIAEIDGKPIVGMCDGLGDNVYGVLVFDAHADEYILAVWTGGEDIERDVDLAVAREAIAVVEPDGKKLHVMAESGATDHGLTRRIEVDRHPRFIHGVDPLVYLPLAGVRFESALTLLAPGESTELKLHIDPRLERPGLRVISTKGSGGVTWNPQTQKLTCAEGSKTGVYAVIAEVELSHGPADDRRSERLTLETQVEVLPAVAVLPRLYMEDGALQLSAAVVNHTSQPQTVALRLVAQGEPIVAAPPLAVEAGATGAVSLPVEPLQCIAGDTVGSVRLVGGVHQSRTIRFYPAQTAVADIEIDGKLDDWAGAAKIEIGEGGQVFAGGKTWSADDASATCYVAFGEDMLYVAAHVRDDDPMHNDQPRYALWKGDSIEVFLGLNGPTRRTVAVEHEEVHVAIAPRSQSGLPMVFRHRPDKPITGASVAAVTTRGGYIIEAAIPLSELDFEGPPAVGDVLALDMTLNDGDADGAAPTHRAAWNGTASNWIDPSEYGVLVVRE